METAFSDFHQLRAGLEDDVAQPSALAKCIFFEYPDTAGDDYLLRVNATELVVFDDFKAFWKT